MSTILVETFEVLDHTEQFSVEADEESRALIEKMGLAGQQALYKDGSETVDLSARCPYRAMTQEEAKVYALLFPEHTAVRRYSEQAIPLRVLQVAAHADAGGWFDEITVWHQKAYVVKDPLLVGMRKLNGGWQATPFILARWGEALDELPALAARAAKTWQRQTIEKLESIVAKAQTDLAIARGMETPGISVLDWNPSSYYSTLADHV